MAKKEPVFVVATLWEYIEPMDRGDRYEDPLEEALTKAKLGATCGGGTQLSAEGGIEFVDIEFEVSNLKRGLAIAKKVLEKAGAPKGSQLRYTENGKDKTLTFGVTECLAVFLDGVNLPKKVYKASPIDDLVDQMRAVLDVKNLGEIRSAWNGPEETALFCFGKSAAVLYTKLKPVLAAYPLCQNARVIVRYGKPSLRPRELHLPMHAG